MTAGARRFIAYGFASVHDAMAAEDVLKSAGVPSLAIPSPRALGELCGIALRVDPAQAQAALGALKAAGLPPVASAEIDDL
jgi:hypothetical protein